MTKIELLKKLLIRPLLALKPRVISENEFLEYALNLRTRIISGYSVIEDFQIPGQKMDGNHPTHGINPIARKRGKLVVRVDDVTHIIDLEYGGKHYRLSRDQWSSILRHVRLHKNNEEI